MNKQIEVTIVGTSPLLMNARPMDETPKGFEKRPAEEQAARAEYRDVESGQLYIPAENIQRCLVSSGSYSKGKGKATLKKLIAACVLVSPQRLLLGVSDYDVDSRYVVVKATGGRILRHRPKINSWKVTMTVEYDDGLVSAKELREVFDNAGKLVGVLDFRPECLGPFGRFIVTHWK